MVTDRDIVVAVVATSRDPHAVTAAELVQGCVVTIRADDPIADLLRTMAHHKLRRLPVIEHHRLVGVVTLADVARHLDDPEIGLVLNAISEP